MGTSTRKDYVPVQDPWAAKEYEIPMLIGTVVLITAVFFILYLEDKAPVNEKQFHNVKEKVIQAERNYREGR